MGIACFSGMPICYPSKTHRWNSWWILGILRYLCKWNILCAIKHLCALLFLVHLGLGFDILQQVVLGVPLELMPCLTETSCPSSAVLAWEGDITWIFLSLFLEENFSLQNVFWTGDLLKHTGKANTFRNSGYSGIIVLTLQLHRVQRWTVPWVP